jgi:ankyrin repeat protein
MEEEPALYTNKVDIWAMGCILYELATGNRPFKSDWAVTSFVHSAKNIEVSLDNTFNVDSIKIITQHIVDMLQATPAARPSASVLSAGFDRHLQLAQESVQLSAVSNSVSTPAITEEIEQTSAKPLKPDGVTESEATLVVKPEPKQTTSTLHGDIVGLSSPGNDAEPLPPHLRDMSLYEAAEKGDLDAVKKLIAAKRDVNAQGRWYGNALQAASFKGFEPVVRLLLENGADVNARGGHFGNALQAASSMGSEAVVRLLLEKGAEVNAQGGNYATALQAASRDGSEAVVRLLLKKGAEVNARGGYYCTPLHAASYKGHEAVVRLLLEKGADVNIQGGYHGTALQAASYGGHEAVVRLLLEKGADVKAQGGKYGSAVMAASKNGHFAVLKLLEANGAD